MNGRKVNSTDRIELSSGKKTREKKKMRVVKKMSISGQEN